MDEMLSKVMRRQGQAAEAFLELQEEFRQSRIAHDAAIADLRSQIMELEKAQSLESRKSFTVPEAAKYAGVKPATIRRWLAHKKNALNGRKKGGLKQSQWRILRRDLDLFLNRMTNAPE